MGKLWRGLVERGGSLKSRNRTEGWIWGLVYRKNYWNSIKYGEAKKN